MNKAEKLRDLTRRWRDEATLSHQRPGTSYAADDERDKTLTDCAREVEQILEDHKGD